MGGFRRDSNNTEFEQNLFNLIILHISQCCGEMRNDCMSVGENLYNHEDKISNRLVECYLDMNSLGLRFILQKPEHYNTETDTYLGRTDIAVCSLDWFKNRNAYYIIECKRIDGSKDLNSKYVSEGISRFVVSPEPKYSSYYGRSIMLGYIVQAILVGENTRKIDELQRKILSGVAIDDMMLVCDNDEGFSRYQCRYQPEGITAIELTHLFYDLSDVI